MKWINYHHLIYFREIAKQGSISKASHILGVGQPALSVQLKQLEEYMQVELFHRKNKRLILTEVGQITLEYAERIAQLGQELIGLIDQKTFHARPRLNVGAVDAIPKNLVSDMVDIAHKKTNCFLSIVEGIPSYLLRLMLTHQVDVIISDQDVTGNHKGQIYSKRIVRSKVSAYATKDFVHLRRDFPYSLTGQPVIMPTSDNRLLSDLNHYFHLHNIYVDIIAETQDTMLQKILACKGDGVTFLPELATKQLIKERKIIKLGNLEHIYVEYFLVYAKKVIENPALSILLKQQFKF